MRSRVHNKLSGWRENWMQKRMRAGSREWTERLYAKHQRKQKRKRGETQIKESSKGRNTEGRKWWIKYIYKCNKCWNGKIKSSHKYNMIAISERKLRTSYFPSNLPAHCVSVTHSTSSLAGWLSCLCCPLTVCSRRVSSKYQPSRYSHTN
jgi:hypothetical protein